MLFCPALHTAGKVGFLLAGHDGRDVINNCDRIGEVVTTAGILVSQLCCKVFIELITSKKIDGYCIIGDVIIATIDIAQAIEISSTNASPYINIVARLSGNARKGQCNPYTL